MPGVKCSGQTKVVTHTFDGKLTRCAPPPQRSDGKTKLIPTADVVHVDQKIQTAVRVDDTSNSQATKPKPLFQSTSETQRGLSHANANAEMPATAGQKATGRVSKLGADTGSSNAAALPAAKSTSSTWAQRAKPSSLATVVAPQHY